MKKTAYDVYRYSDIVVLVFGILGNILVVTSILRQNIVMKNNYYYLLSQLAICDLGVLVVYLVDRIASYWYEEALFYYSLTSCVFSNTYYVFQVAGIGMMLIISVLRYRATLHPLKPAISRRKLKVVCSLVHCWFDCGLWNISTAMFYAWERYRNCLFQISLRLLCILLLHFSYNIYGCTLL
jgi:hypothetical protein